MSLIYVSSRPARFQPGDLVQGTVTSATKASEYGTKRDYADDEAVTGVITRWVNYDNNLLDRGMVEIKTETGDILWVQASRVITTRGELNHPLVELAPVQRFVWTCRCGKHGAEETEDAARNEHRLHADRAH